MNWKGRFLALLTVLVLGVGLAACGSGSDSDGSDGDQPSNAVTGIDWQLLNIASSDGWATGLPSGVDPPTVRFDDGKVEVFAGCNTGSGSAEVGDADIVFGPIAMTMKSCDATINQIEKIVTGVLKGKATYTIKAGNLNLTKGKITLIYSQG
ncbi:MAG: META domain-containing protein [Solirubrobacterales bacterium]|nr:META domain-containing protein [Solirubrobacterales bacterium]